MSEAERPQGGRRRSARIAARSTPQPKRGRIRSRSRSRSRPASRSGHHRREADGGSSGGKAAGRGSATVEVRPRERYYLARILFLRYLGLLYFIAFGIATRQNRALLGENGITPYALKMEATLASSHNDWSKAFWQAPSLLWFVKPSDENLLNLSWAGMALSLLPMLHGACNSVVLFALWVLYTSIVNVGGTFYAFGWETLLLEVGFWAITISPALRWHRFPEFSTPPLVVWAMRLLLFRVMIGAGLIKIRGDRCWRDLTCMTHHYETQPLPNPLSFWLHGLPSWWHSVETATNHVVELVAPLLLLCPRRLRLFGGLVQVGFQAALILSGNLSFLNYLTIAPAIMCFDDEFLLPIVRPWPFLGVRAETRGRLGRRYRYEEEERRRRSVADYFEPGNMVSLVLAFLLLGLSRNVYRNLASPNQVMNTSFDSLKLVNTYGAFGSVSKERKEVVLEATMAEDFSNPSALWEEYSFKCKPSGVRRRPCVLAPWHLRLDWLMWFAAFGENVNRYPWLVSLMDKLLSDPSAVSGLLEELPFEGKPPKAVRATLYDYKFANATEGGAWWRRERVGEYCGPLTLGNASVRRYLRAHGLVRREEEGEEAAPRMKRKPRDSVEEEL